MGKQFKLGKYLLLLLVVAFSTVTNGQVIRDTTYHEKVDTVMIHSPDTIFLKPADTVLRIKNFTPYFTLHVDSTLDYHFILNKVKGNGKRILFCGLIALVFFLIWAELSVGIFGRSFAGS